MPPSCWTDIVLTSDPLMHRFTAALDLQNYGLLVWATAPRKSGSTERGVSSNSLGRPHDIQARLDDAGCRPVCCRWRLWNGARGYWRRQASAPVVVAKSGNHCKDDPHCMNRYHYAIKPVAHVQPGQLFVLETRDALIPT